MNQQSLPHIRQNGRVNCRKTYCGILIKTIPRDAANIPGIVRYEIEQGAAPSLWCSECIKAMNIQPREKTKKEVVDELLTQIIGAARYWEHDDRTPDVRGKLEGLAFSILVIIDGGSMELPAFDLTPSPHPDDKKYLKDRGENWYPNTVINDDVQLHELFSARKHN